jgi:Protein of unknown function (DUF2750)
MLPMPLHVSDQQYNAVLALPGPDRYEHLIKRIADEEEVWSLRGPDGWVLATDEGRDLVPIWPHPRYAEACAVGEWAGTTPTAISLEEWAADWLSDMEEDGRGVSVFPTPDGRTVVVDAAQFMADLDAELEQYE